MPFVRDRTFAFETVTSNGGITIDLPRNEANDLLLMFVVGDTGAPTWTPPANWSTHFSRNNTLSTTCIFKISSGSEPATVTIDSNVNETYHAHCLSIGDVNTANPFGNPIVSADSAQAAVAKFDLNTISTNVANALVIYFAANSSPGVPSILEGACSSLLGADGAAESSGVAWGFQALAGITPTVTCSAVAAAAGVKATLQIAPPSGGAVVIPTYCAGDASSYLNPVHGVTAYNSDTALAATADTNYGTTLGGVPAVDATVAAVTDVGINSFHSMAQLTTNASTSMSGAELVFAVANRPNIGTNNLLCHVQVATPASLQRLGTVGSGRGVWMGVRSGAATNYKIWQVLGADSPGAAGRPVPIIINDGAGNTKASAGALNAAAVLSVGLWASASSVGTAALQFGSLWLMSKTTVAGGNASNPITVPGIVAAIAGGKERISAIQQGASQMLLLQDVQIGNGGAAPVYLDLDATAIEFPRQYDAASKQVNYNSTDNVVGMLYYAGPADVIKHRNSVVSSPSKFKWGLHASASASATYDFDGLQVIGAGTVTLDKAITITGLTLHGYGTIAAAGADFVRSTIRGCPSGNDSITLDAASSFTACTIDVSGVASGNPWASVASPAIFSGCVFTGGGGHALRITTAGTYSLTGNTFTGFGGDGSNGAAIFNDSGGAVTLNISGGGSTPTMRHGSGASTTINNNVTVTLTGLKSQSEVRVFNAGTQTERAGTGAENITSGMHAFSVPASMAVDIAILSLGYQNMRLLAYSTATDAGVPVSQVLDRQYANP